MGALYLKPAEMIEIMKSKVPGDEKFIGGFHAQSRPDFWKIMLFGIFAMMKMRIYLVGVSDQKIYFHRLDMMNRVEAVDVFAYEEINGFTFKKGLLMSKMMFKFSNGNKLTLTMIVRNKGIYLSENIIDYLKGKLPWG